MKKNRMMTGYLFIFIYVVNIVHYPSLIISSASVFRIRCEGTGLFSSTTMFFVPAGMLNICHMPNQRKYNYIMLIMLLYD